jgi:hypothetical protein
MKSPIVATSCLVVLAAAWPARAERVSFGVSARRDRSCLRGVYTGLREQPNDVWGPAGRESGCTYEDDLVRTNVGVLINIPLSRRFALRLDPGLSTTGYQTYGRTAVTFRLDSIQLPVHGRFVLVPGGVAHPYLLAGGFVSRWRNRDSIDDVFSYDSRWPRVVSYLYRKEHWRGWNAGLSGGAGVAFDIAPVQVFGEVTFERGLVDIYGGRNREQRTRNRRVAGGFTFQLGGGQKGR